MPEHFYPKAAAARIQGEMIERIDTRTRAELVPLLVTLFRHSDLTDSQIDAVWCDAVEKLFAEELKRAQSALEAVAVEGSA